MNNKIKRIGLYFQLPHSVVSAGGTEMSSFSFFSCSLCGIPHTLLMMHLAIIFLKRG